MVSKSKRSSHNTIKRPHQSFKVVPNHHQKTAPRLSQFTSSKQHPRGILQA
ncbi:hypothetical protein SeseC_00582 [Streptococcus equi subsp. zooepidemicus ATCC 35246]|nr:hypothetical protein SeseC_00582 [Streptococcus equi subsp. zooepidemicus ATCC 35246]